MVGAVVEQVYSSTFKFRLLKIQEICPLKRFIAPLNAPKMRLVAGLCPDLLGGLQRSPDPLAEFKGSGKRGEGREGEMEQEV